MKTSKPTEEAPSISNPPNWAYVQPEGGLQRLYANAFRFTQSEADVRITFGEGIDVDVEANTVIVQERTAVTMSWLQLKLMVDYLQQAVSAFERRNGAIKRPALPLLPEDEKRMQPSETKSTWMN